MNRYPSLSQEQAEEIYQLVTAASAEEKAITATLVATVPPSFSVRAKSTKNTVEGMIRGGKTICFDYRIFIVWILCGSC